MKIDVVNADNKKVGSVDLNDDVFGGRVKTDLIHESVVRATPPNAAAPTRPRTAPWSAAARSRGARRAPAAPASAKPATRCGARAAPCSARRYRYSIPKKVEKGARCARPDAEAAGRLA